MAEQVIKPPYHQFILSNNDGLVVRCCSRCGLSHLLGQDQRTFAPLWTLIPEEKGDISFSEPCPTESTSDAPFGYHQFILSNHHRTLMRFCVRCGLSHTWKVDVRNTLQGRIWRLVGDNERDVMLSEPCPTGLEFIPNKQRYEPAPLY